MQENFLRSGSEARRDLHIDLHDPGYDARRAAGILHGGGFAADGPGDRRTGQGQRHGGGKAILAAGIGLAGAGGIEGEKVPAAAGRPPPLSPPS